MAQCCSKTQKGKCTALLKRLHNSIMEANETIKKQFITWNSSVLSGEIFLKRGEIDSELLEIKENLNAFQKKLSG